MTKEQCAELLAAMKEIQTICGEDNSTFRKRGGTRWGLISIVANAAIAKVSA